MKKNNLLYALASIAFMGGALTSCSSDGDGLEENNNINIPTGGFNIKLQQTAETRCSSNDYPISDYSWWYYKEAHEYGKFASKAPGEISQAEKDYVKNYLADHPNEGGTEFNHYNYFIQYVGGSYDTYTIDFKNADGSIHHSQQITGSNQMDFIQFVDQNGETKHINDYNAGGGPRALVVNTMIKKAQYHDSYNNLTFDNKYRFYTIENVPQADGTTATCHYLCFDYATEKDDNGHGVVAGDGKYNDYVIKLTPACDEPTTPTEPEQPGTEPEQPGTDPEQPGTDPEQPGTEPEQPETPAVVVSKGHVEVNLAVQDHKDENSTKLSVHVRDTVNFKVFLPVSDKYYCSADDMYIVEKHYEQMTYNDLTEVVEREIDGQKVTFTVTYATEGIYVESAGINAKVLEYCRNVYGDGLTFEIWNYYNSEITRKELIALMNQATIEFTDNEPAEYINTIIDTNVDEAEGNKLDCIVTKK